MTFSARRGRARTAVPGEIVFYHSLPAFVKQTGLFSSISAIAIIKLRPIQTRPVTYIPSKLLTFEEFIAQYGDNARYELIDGEIRDREPTGPHEAVAGSIAGRLYVEIFRFNLNWLVPKTCLIKPLYSEATALRPDVVVLDKAELRQEPLWQK